MTREALQAKRDEILGRLDEIRVSSGDRSVEYADAAKSLALIDAEISRIDAQSSSSSRFRTSFATFTK